MNNPTNKVVDVLIIGAGFAGLGMAIGLKQSGIHNVVILERDQKVGGTWRDNQYPGAACDIPSNLYSYSFAPNPEWSRSYSSSREILSYIHSLVNQYELMPLIRFNQNVDSLRFDEEKGIWTARTREGQLFQARTAVMASGPLSNCSFPSIRGIEEYAGHKIHSARWDHEYDLSNKKVAVIGTGASAVQIVPELVKKVKQLTVFQRTPGWVLPRFNSRTPTWQQSLFKQVPLSQKAVRHSLYAVHEAMALAVIWNTPATRFVETLSTRHLRNQVADKWMRRQLSPNFRIGCKRVLLSNEYYPALQADNCKLITWPIDRFSEKGIRTAEGIEHQFDCVVFATGFDVSKNGTPFEIIGLHGRRLGDEWASGAKAYKSINVAGFPNLFLTFGPNSGPGHNSVLVYVESQLNYAVRGIRRILQENLLALDVNPTAQEKYNKAIQTRLKKTNWNSGCKSWYLSEDGFNSTMYPGFATQYAKQMQDFELADYHRVYAKS